MDLQQEQSLRTHLKKLLSWEDAHVSFDAATARVPIAARGRVAPGMPHTLWQLVEHLRLCQLDILDFCRNPDYEDPPREEYWPKTPAPPSKDAWEKSLAATRRDRKALAKLALDPSVDLFARIPHGSGQTYLRELILVADHNAYHVGQIVALRRALGIWEAA
jgi:uncharacterized damage-inducible protein DinB